MTKDMLTEADRAILVEALRLANRTYQAQAYEVRERCRQRKQAGPLFEQQKQMEKQASAARQLCRRIQQADAIDLREIA